MKMTTLRDSMKKQAALEAKQEARELREEQASREMLANPQIGILIRKGKTVYYNSTTLQEIA
jgi:Neuraminidase (sialidase)